MRFSYAILGEDKEVIPIAKVEDWSRYFEEAHRHVGDDTILGIRVSTVFLGINHGYFEDENLWFETMIFEPSYLRYDKYLKRSYMTCSEFFCERYSTWEEAEIGHKLAFSWLKERLQLSGQFQLQLTDKET